MTTLISIYTVILWSAILIANLPGLVLGLLAEWFGELISTIKKGR